MKIHPRILRSGVVVHDALALAIAFASAHLVVFGADRIMWVPGIQEKTLAYVLIGGACLYAM